MLGELLGNYKLVKEIGRGGMGAVYLAEHTQFPRKAAAKVLLPEFAANQEMVERFFDEARAASMITYPGTETRHPGIVEIFDCGRHASGAPYIIMEYLEGESLGEALERVRSLAGDLSSLTAIGGQIAGAMAAAHAREIVHRDLKPDNVFLTSQPALGRLLAVKILDFGIAKLAASKLSAVKTQPGMVIGTPRYMSPEQCRGEPDVGPASDIYSLGCILFELVCGRPPFVIENPVELMAAHLSKEPPRLAALEPRAPAALDALVTDMLAKTPAARPASMGQVELLLADVGAAARTEKRPRPDVPAPGGNGTKVFPRARSGRSSSTPGESVTPPAALEEAGADANGRPAPPGRPARSTLAIAAGAGALLVALAVTAAAFHHSPLPEKVTVPDASTPAARIPDPPAGMVYLAGGAFRMGSTEEELAAALEWCRTRSKDCSKELLDREKPARDVGVGPFFLDRTEVTNDDFHDWLNERSFRVEQDRFVRDERGQLVLDLHPAYGGIASSSRFTVREGHAGKPVVQVTWLAAERYCRDRGKRLPTEAEWEFAARGAGRRRFPWGEQDPRCGEVAFGGLKDSGCPAAKGPEPVGAAPDDVTPEGVRDLGGNVAEWVADAYEAPYPGCGGCADPLVQGGDGPGVVRSIRGGDWTHAADACRAAGRGRREQDKAQIYVGFRCAKSAPKPGDRGR